MLQDTLLVTPTLFMYISSRFFLLCFSQLILFSLFFANQVNLTCLPVVTIGETMQQS